MSRATFEPFHIRELANEKARIEGGRQKLPASNTEKTPQASKVRVILEQALGPEMADTIIVGSCNILSIEEKELYGENLNLFIIRMEIVVPAIIGLRPGEVVVDRLRRL